MDTWERFWGQFHICTCYCPHLTDGNLVIWSQYIWDEDFLWTQKVGEKRRFGANTIICATSGDVQERETWILTQKDDIKDIRNWRTRAHYAKINPMAACEAFALPQPDFLTAAADISTSAQALTFSVPLDFFSSSISLLIKTCSADFSLEVLLHPTCSVSFYFPATWFDMLGEAV